MRIHHALPILAALALAACGGDADEELAGEALSLEEAAGDAAGDDAIMPAPGQYRTTTGTDHIQHARHSRSAAAGSARAAFAEGCGAEPTSYCVTRGNDAAKQWLSGMAESRCTASRFDVTGNNIEAVMAVQCRGWDQRQGDPDGHLRAQWV